MQTKLTLLLCSTLALMACQQSQAGNEGTIAVAPAPVVEPIDPAKDPVGAVKANKQQVQVTNSLSEQRKTILQMIGDAKADSVQQCRVVGFGSKPCGGPAGYLAFSAKQTDETELMALVAKYNNAAKAENERQGLMSDCSIVAEPAVELKNGSCSLATGAVTAR